MKILVLRKNEFVCQSCRLEAILSNQIFILADGCWSDGRGLRKQHSKPNQNGEEGGPQLEGMT